MRPRRRLRMILHAEDWLRVVTHAFHRLIVQINAIDRDLGGQRTRIDRETVVLGSDFDPAAFEILDRLISSAMTKLQLEGLATKGLTQNLVA